MNVDYAAVLERFGPALRRVAESYERDGALQDDLFQEICLAVWRALPSFRGEASLKTFLFRVAHNRGATHSLRESRRPVALEEPERIEDCTPNPEAAATERQRRAALVGALHQLSLASRQVMTLRLEGLSYAEIAQIVGASENAVTVRASRARSQLRRLLCGGETDERDRP